MILKLATPKIHKSENVNFEATLKSNLFSKDKIFKKLVLPVVQDYLNEILVTIYGPNKPKTSGKPLRIPDLQPPASNKDKQDTL